MKYAGMTMEDETPSSPNGPTPSAPKKSPPPQRQNPNAPRQHTRNRFLSGFKVLVQHLYPGHSRNEVVAHGTIPTLEFHGTRRIESQVGRRHSLRAKAEAMQRAPSTLSRELARHPTTPVTYRAVPAHQRAQRWPITRASSGSWPSSLACARRSSRCLRTAGPTNRLSRALPQRHPDEPTMVISHEAIYTYLYVLPCGALKRDLARYLRHRHRFRRLRKVRRSSRPIQDLICIDEQPQEVANRTIPGHWEGATVLVRKCRVSPRTRWSERARFRPSASRRSASAGSRGRLIHDTPVLHVDLKVEVADANGVQQRRHDRSR